mmetsp:Transcript_17975/g.39310  ORF Transcript_17975/g.39310 Transcript_17975/m.39310 type:complete len:253 (-) Transcript_17975:620-1378(-)
MKQEINRTIREVADVINMGRSGVQALVVENVWVSTVVEETSSITWSRSIHPAFTSQDDSSPQRLSAGRLAQVKSALQTSTVQAISSLQSALLVHFIVSSWHPIFISQYCPFAQRLSTAMLLHVEDSSLHLSTVQSILSLQSVLLAHSEVSPAAVGLGLAPLVGEVSSRVGDGSTGLSISSWHSVALNCNSITPFLLTQDPRKSAVGRYDIMQSLAKAVSSTHSSFSQQSRWRSVSSAHIAWCTLLQSWIKSG